MSSGSDLMARLQMFLPQIAQANSELAQSINQHGNNNHVCIDKDMFECDDDNSSSRSDESGSESENDCRNGDSALGKGINMERDNDEEHDGVATAAARDLSPHHESKNNTNIQLELMLGNYDNSIIAALESDDDDDNATEDA
jgi:hypothetical protein